MRGDLARDERLALAEGRGAIDQAGRDEREDLADVGEVGRRVHPHQDEVVALREHVLVHLLRALGHDDQVEAELAPLAGDADRVLGRERGDGVAGLGRADVVGLVDHDGHRLASRTPAPEPLEHGGGGDRLLLARAQRAEIDDEAAGPGRVLELRQQRSSSGPGQMPKRSTPRLRARSFSAFESTCSRSERLWMFSSSTSAVSSAYSSRSASGSSRITAACSAGPSSRKRTRIPAGPSAPLRTSIESVSGSEALESRWICVRARVRQPHVVRVRIEHHDAQVGLHQQPLQEHAERVGLARARLAAEEGVAPEAAPVQSNRHSVRQRQLPDLEGASRGRRPGSSHSPTSSGRAGCTIASWNGRPSPSSTTPSPPPARMRTCGSPGPVASWVSSSNESTCPRRVDPSLASDT